MTSVSIAQAARPHPMLVGLNDAQLRAVTATGNLQVMAGPGTGKTEVIARRYAWLWKQLAEQHPTADSAWLENQLLVVTFTQKAAQEMRHRIALQLERLTGERPELSGHWIGTFHQTARHWLAGVGQQPHLLTDTEQFLLDKQLCHQLVCGQLIDCLPALQWAELDGAIAPDCLSVEAMTTLPLPALMPFIQDLPKLVQRIQSAGLTPLAFYREAMQQTNAFTEAILALSMTDPLTGGVFERPEDALDVWQRQLAPYTSPLWQALPDGWQPDAMKASELYEQLAPLKKHALTYNKKTKRYEPLPLSDWQHPLLAATETETALIPVVAAFYAYRCYVLHQQQQSDYDGLLSGLLTHWQQHPADAQRAAGQFKAVIVDEFQDTNPAQLSILKAFDPPMGLTVVGDAKQSIYGFRHADPDNLNLIFKDKADVAIVTLTDNYRSVPVIVDTANTFAKRCQLDTTPPLQAQHPALADLEPLVVINYAEDLGNITHQRAAESDDLVATLLHHRHHYDGVTWPFCASNTTGPWPYTLR
jgi:ATP-dependent helicase/nuclease subunit A